MGPGGSCPDAFVKHRGRQGPAAVEPYFSIRAFS